MSNHQIAVFLGPTCPAEEAREYLENADYYAPAIRGSFYNIINDGYRLIVLIDGLFYGSLSVWHKEIMFALDSGIEVIGASSIGALRAAELQGMGMTGVGTIFSWYRDGVIDGDDEVALLHGGIESSFFGLTIPLVNLRWNLSNAARNGVITRQEEAMVIESARQLCFTERTVENILNPLKESFDIVPVKNCLGDDGENLKKLDAIEALKMARSRQFDESLPVVSPLRDYETVHMNVGIAYYKSERMVSIKAKHGDTETPLVDYALAIADKASAYGDLVRARSYQKLIVGWARELRLDQIEGEDSFGVESNWRPESIDFEFRRATGLTLIDIAREHRDAVLSHSLQRRFCPAGAMDIVKALDERLMEQAQEMPVDWEKMIRLNGRLIYTLWRLGQKKQIAESQDSLEQKHNGTPVEELQAQVDRIMGFIRRIDELGTTHFGYTLDAAREIVLAHQYLNCLNRIAAADHA